MVHLRSSRFAVLWFCLGLLIIPFGLGHFEITDLTVRVPAVVLLLLDAGVTLQFAVVYQRDVWPYRTRIKETIRCAMFDPVFAWIAALGYYFVAAWTVMAIVATPDGAVRKDIAFFFVSGYALIAVWKLVMLRFCAGVAREFDDSE